MARSVAYLGTRAAVLANVARGVMATDPDRAALLTAEAVETVGRLPGDEKIWWILRDVARAVASTQPDRAVTLVSPVRDQSAKAWALTAVAQAAAPTYPNRVEQIARSITDGFLASRALSWVAQALATDRPERAERIAWLATVQRDKVKALAGVAHEAAATNPGQSPALNDYLAETADQLASESAIERLAEFTVAVAPTHPALAEQQAAICLNAIGHATNEELRIENVLSVLCTAVEVITAPAR